MLFFFLLIRILCTMIILELDKLLVDRHSDRNEMAFGDMRTGRRRERRNF